MKRYLQKKIFNKHISKIIDPTRKYTVKSLNFIDFLETEKKVFDAQDKFYSNVSVKNLDDTIWSVEYYKDLNQAILDFLGKVKSKFILDLGSGIGADTNRLLKMGANVVSLDSSEKSLRISANFNKNIHIRADGARLPFKNNSFDVIFGRDILHHLNEKECLIQIRRVLKKGGYAVFQEPLRFSPLVFLYRFLKRSERVPQHPFSSGQLKKLSQTDFRKFKAKSFYTLFPFFYIFILFFPKYKKLFSKVYLSKFSKLDSYISNRFPYFSWIQVVKFYKK